MKKVLLTIAILLLIPSYSWAWHSGVMAAGVAAAGDTYSDILFYHGFETSTTCASDNAEYSAGDNTPTCQSGAAIDTTTIKVGANSLSIPTGYDRMQFTVSSGDIADHLSGRVGFYFYATAWPTNDSLFRIYYDASNYIEGRAEVVSTYNRVFLIYRTGGASVNIRGTTNLSLDTWYFLEFSWNQGGAGNDFVLYTNGVSTATDDTASNAWDGIPTLLEIGDVQGNTSAQFYIDQFFSSSDPARDLNAIKDCTTCNP